jgi:hypothetical protein
MQKYYLLLVTFYVSTFCSGQSTASDPQLAQTENQFFTALKTKNFTGLETLYDNSFYGILTTGKKVNKAAMVEFQKSNDSLIAKSFENLETRIFGEVAISTGIEINSSKTGTKLGQLRFIRIFVRKNNVWTIIQSQFTTII